VIAYGPPAAWAAPTALLGGSDETALKSGTAGKRGSGD
jgi:hypothetical protein